jgi:hypothetical protein
VKFRVPIPGVLLLAAVLSALPARGDDRPGTGADMPRLNMEELEVRGKRGNPDVLYFPVPEGIYFLSPVRYDVIREELIRPVEEGKYP